MILIIIYYMIH